MGNRKHDLKSIFSNNEHPLTSISGIYMITNKFNGKRYIGTSVDCFKRGLNHYTQLYNYKHEITSMQDEFGYCGMKYFDFRILYKYDDDDQKMIHVPERIFIKSIKPEYNRINYKCNINLEYDAFDDFPKFEPIISSILSVDIKNNWANCQRVIKQM